MGAENIRAVSADSVDRQLTAKGLIGKDVYDNANKKVGEVRDVVLDASGAPQLASAFSSRSGNRSTSSGSSTGSSTRSGASDMTNSDTSGTGMSGTGATGSASGTGSTMGSTSGRGDLSSSFSSTMGSGPAAIISYGGFMGAGGTLFRVPLSQLRYDSSNDRLTLNVSDSELSSLKNSNTSRGAAE